MPSLPPPATLCRWGGGGRPAEVAVRAALAAMEEFELSITCLFASVGFTCLQQRKHLFHSEDASFRTYLQKAFRLLLLSPPNSCHGPLKDQAIYLPKPLFGGHLSLIPHLVPNIGP